MFENQKDQIDHVNVLIPYSYKSLDSKNDKEMNTFENRIDQEDQGLILYRRKSTKINRGWSMFENQKDQNDHVNVLILYLDLKNGKEWNIYENRIDRKNRLVNRYHNKTVNFKINKGWNIFENQKEQKNQVRILIQYRSWKGDLKNDEGIYSRTKKINKSWYLTCTVART